MRALLLTVLLGLAGCLGGADPNSPHHLVLSNQGTTAVAGNVSVVLDGEVLLSRSFELDPRGEDRAEFGPASIGEYRVRVVVPDRAPFEEAREMGAGGWGMYVAFSAGRISLSTLHGD